MPLSTTLLSTKIFATMALSAAAAGNSNLRPHHRVGNNAASSLLQKARPFSSRKLDDNANNQQQQPSIKFSSCVDMKLLPDEYTDGGADDTMLSYVKSGKLMSTKSYVLFYMCNGDTCDEDDLYVVDIGTYTKNIASYFVNYEDGICRACNQYADYCNSNDDGSSSGSSYSSYGNNNNGNNNYYGNRELKNFDCDECDQYNCFSTNYNYVYNEDVNDLIDDISECLRTGSEMNGEDLYVGPMCSDSGDGVELAIFMDDKCSEYTTQKAFADLPGYYMYQSPYVFNITKDAFQKAFSDSVSCDDMDISSPYNGNYNYNNGDGGMNDYCQQVLNEGVGLSSCYGNNYNGNQNNGNYNQNNGNYYNQGDDYQGDDVLSWYDYDIAYDDAKDIDQVCSAIYEMAGSYSNYYDSSKSGSWYKKSKSSSINDYIDMDVNEETAAAALGLLFFSVGALAAGFYLYKKQKAKAANEKLQPLQENEKGVMT